jgi:hypothetical protein
MPTVCIMEFDRETRHFQLLTTIEFFAIPSKGDKITLNLGENQEGFIFDALYRPRWNRYQCH